VQTLKGNRRVVWLHPITIVRTHTSYNQRDLHPRANTYIPIYTYTTLYIENDMIVWFYPLSVIKPKYLID
jgi:hypothetical protein